jgi:heme-degrading monooxygenase HmoA
MFVRVNNITGAENIDAGVTFLQDKVVPELVGQKGFRGVTASANRSNAQVGILTLWDTLADLEASASTASKLRGEAMAVLGGEVNVVVMEQVFADVATPQDMTGKPLRVVRISMDPAKVDEHLAFFVSDVVPGMKATPGFLAVRNMVNRSTGEGTVGTVWADEESMRASETTAQQRSQIASERGVQISEPSFRTILLSHLL